MWSKSDIRRLSQPLLLGAGFAVMAMVGLAAGLLAQQAQDNAAWVAHTLDVEGKINEVLLAVRRSESAERGYLITGSENYLNDYRLAAERVEPRLEELRGVVGDNASQAARVERMTPLIQKRLQDFRQVTALRNENKIEAAAEMVARPESRDVMLQIVDLANEMRAEEQRLFAQRTDDTADSYRFLYIVMIVGGLLIVLLGMTALWLLYRSNRERDVAEQGLIETNENLEKIVTERSSDLIAANEEVQRFAYIVSHDLRSPLVNIMGFTTELEALRDQIFAEMAELRQRSVQSGSGEEDSEQEKEDQLVTDFDEAIQFIKNSITKMDRLIGAVLRLSREGRRDFKVEFVEMNPLMSELVSTLAHQAIEAEAEISLGDLPDLHSDRLAVEQIFSNLVDNALKYLRPGVPGAIEVTGRETPLQVIYEIKDNGRGIDEKDYARIFELFRRSGQQDRPGEGIGLAHVRALVRRLGGDLKVSSILGEGTTFTVSLAKRLPRDRERTAA